MEWIAGILALLGVVYMALRGKKAEGKLSARLDNAEENLKAVTKDAEIDADYSGKPRSAARDELLRKIKDRKHMP